MNGIGAWSSARHTDGREYWYNKETNKTTWEKPEEIWTQADRLIYSQPWRALKTGEGKEYYHNKETNETSWEMPEVFKQVKALSDPPAAPVPARPSQQSQNFVAGGDRHSNRYDRDDYDRRGQDRRIEYGQSDTSRSSFLPAAAPEARTYTSLEEAEKVFYALLKRVKVQADWTWEQTMRATISDPEYRAIADPKDRKRAFEKYIEQVRAQDKEKEKERVAKLRQDFTTMLKSHPEIKYYTRWRTAREIIEGETIFRSASDDTERRQLYEEYRASLQSAHAAKEVESRKLAREELNDVLWSLDLEPYTRWAKAQDLLEANEQFHNDDKFKTLDKGDILKAYEAHVKLLERQTNAARKLELSRKGRQERKAREEFRQLLKDLVKAGKLRVSTKFKDLFPLIEDDPRFVALCKTEGSSPLDLFWDEIEAQEDVLKTKKSMVLDAIEGKVEMDEETTLEDLLPTLQADSRTRDMSKEDLEEVFKKLHARVLQLAEDDKRQREREQDRAVDRLRHKIKYLEPPVRISDSWERDVIPRVKDSKEYRAVETDELRQSAFEKYIKRLKEKEAEEEQRRERRERDREREREREGRRRRDTRSPEVDVYEADRRRAIADRERSYRRGSVTSGLSPPPTSYSPGRRGVDSYYPDRDDDRERDRRDRYRPGSPRSYRAHSPTPYDRERRAREMERERAYMSRADPREGVAKELDYGDSRAGSMAESTPTGTRRPHRSSPEADPRRDIKRRKVDYRSQSPPEVDMKEEVAVRSGSEEGEIEEVTPEEAEKEKNGHAHEEVSTKQEVIDKEEAKGETDAMEE